MKNGRRFGSPPKPYTPPEQPAGKINVTDPDSRTLKTPRGFLQGYNAQAVCNEQQIVVAAEVSVSSADFGQMGPMIDKARAELAAAGVTESPGIVLADAGYWHGEQIDELMGQGVQVLIPPDADKRRGNRTRFGHITRHNRNARNCLVRIADDLAIVRPFHQCRAARERPNK